MKGSGRTFAMIAFLLLVPLIAYFAAVGVQWKFNSELRQELVKDYPDKAAILNNVTVTNLCQNPDLRSDHGFSDVCSDNDNFEWMKTGAIVAGCVGVLMIVIIKLAGLISRKRRSLLLLLFAPGLHLTMLVMSALSILYAALGIAAIYYGESAFIGRIHIGVMLAFGIGALVTVATLIRAQFTTVRRANTTALGKRLDYQQQGKLWNFVVGLADRMGAERPQSIVAGLEPNFYVTEANVTCLDGKLTGRTMYISLPLCRILSVDEFTAVIAHELGHYKGADTKFSKRFFPIYRGTIQAMSGIMSGRSEKGSAADLVRLPVFVVLSYFLDSFSVAENEISRDRELAADDEASNAVSAKSMATALIKVHAYSSIWPAVKNHMKELLGQGQMLKNASSFFATIAFQIPEADVFGEVSQEGPVHPTDTHPPLSVRLKSLNFSLSELKADATVASLQNSAIELVDSADGLEGELSDTIQAIMVKSGEAPLGAQSITATATA
jgi:Zn-dependent protease with chaperone function